MSIKARRVQLAHALDRCLREYADETVAVDNGWPADDWPPGGYIDVGFGPSLLARRLDRELAKMGWIPPED